MTAPRFYVVALDGFPEIGSSAPNLTASVLDRAYSHREVARFTSPPGGGAPGVRGGVSRAALYVSTRAQADAEAARLNAEHDAWAAE